MNLPNNFRLRSAELTDLKSLRPNQSHHSSFFILKFFENEDTKFGFIISKSGVKKATDRNLIRRRLKSVVVKSLGKGKIKKGFYVVIAKNALSSKTTYEKITAELNQILSKIS